MENVKKVLKAINTKTNFILSAVNGTKDKMIKDDLTEEIEVYDEAIELKSEELFYENSQLQDETDDLLDELIADKILTHYLIFETDIMENATEQEKKIIAKNSTLDEIDFDLSYERKENIYKVFTQFKDEEYYYELLKYFEDLIDE